MVLGVRQHVTAALPYHVQTYREAFQITTRGRASRAPPARICCKRLSQRSEEIRRFKLSLKIRHHSNGRNWNREGAESVSGRNRKRSACRDPLCSGRLVTASERVTVVPSVIRRFGTAAPSSWPPPCTTRPDLACSLRAVSATASSLAAAPVRAARAAREVLSRWAARYCADAARREGVRAP